MYNKFKRLGTVPCKVQITVDLKELTVPDPIDGITLLCVELSSRSKTTLSSSKLWSDKGSPSIIQFNEQIKLTITMYKDTNGNFREKKGRFNLYGNKQAEISSTLLGFLDLNLHLLGVDDAINHSKLEFRDIKGRKIGILSVVSTSKSIFDINEIDSTIGRSSSSGKERNVPYERVYVENVGKGNTCSNKC